MAVALFPETGDTLTQTSLRDWVGAAVPNVVVSGYTVSSTAALVVTLALGEAIIEGVHVKDDATRDVTVGDNTTTYVYLKKDGTTTTNMTGTTPVDAVPICSAVASGGTITSTTDLRRHPALSDTLYVNPSGELFVSTRGTFRKDDNSHQVLVSGRNASTGTAAVSTIQAAQDHTANQYIRVSFYGSGFTTSGLNIAASGQIQAGAAATGGLVLNAMASAPIILGTNNAERARINGSGNWGFGTSDIETTAANEKAIHFGDHGYLQYGTGALKSLLLGHNIYNDGVVKYRSTNPAAVMRVLTTGGFQFDVAPSGSIDTTIVWKTQQEISTSGIKSLEARKADYTKHITQVNDTTGEALTDFAGTTVNNAGITMDFVVHLITEGVTGDCSSLYQLRVWNGGTPVITALKAGAHTSAPRLVNNGGTVEVRLNTDTTLRDVRVVATQYYT